MCASCHPTIRCHFLVKYFSVKYLSVATLSHSVLIEYTKSTQGHMLRSIPVYSGISAYSGKRTHRFWGGWEKKN